MTELEGEARQRFWDSIPQTPNPGPRVDPIEDWINAIIFGGFLLAPPIAVMLWIMELIFTFKSA